MSPFKKTPWLSIESLLLRYLPGFIQKFLARIRSSPLGYRMARGIFWSIGGAVISRALMLGAFIFVARILGRESFGELGIIRSTVNMFLVFAGYSLGLTATKYIAELREKDPVRTGRIMSLSIVIAVVLGAIISLMLWILAPWLASHTLNSPKLVSILRIGAVILFINAINGVQTGTLAGFEAFKSIARVNFWAGLLSFPVLVIGAYFGKLPGAVWGLAGSMSINCILNHLALKKEAKSCNILFLFRTCMKELPILWKFSMPAALSGMMVTPVMWVCNAFLVNQPGGYGQMGIFDAANQWRLAILFVPNLMGRIVLPMLTNLDSQLEYTNYLKVFKINVLINSGTSFVFATLVALMASLIMATYGQGFEGSNWVLTILAFSAALTSFTAVIGQVIASKSRMWTGLIFNILWGIALIILSYIFIHNGNGALGLALAYLLAYFFHSLWQYGFVSFLIKNRTTGY